MLQVAQQLPQFGMLAVNLLAQGRAIDKLHGDEVLSLDFISIINVSDVRMIEPCGRVCFLLKPAQSVFEVINMSLLRSESPLRQDHVAFIEQDIAKVLLYIKFPLQSS